MGAPLFASEALVLTRCVRASQGSPREGLCPCRAILVGTGQRLALTYQAVRCHGEREKSGCRKTRFRSRFRP